MCLDVRHEMMDIYASPLSAHISHSKLKMVLKQNEMAIPVLYIQIHVYVKKLVIFLILVIESSGKVYLLTQLTLYPAGSVSVLPTILCLTTNVLRETAEPSLDGKSAPTVTSCMQALRSLATCSFVKDPRCANDWEKFLQSTLATILDYSNPGIKLSSFTGRPNFSKLSSI